MFLSRFLRKTMSMKKSHILLVCYLLSSVLVSAADKYWVGPLGSNWSYDANWSLMSGGVGGAGKPGSNDAVIFSGVARVNVDISPTIYSLRTSFGSSNVTLYTSGTTSITILNSLRVEPFSSLKDSTSDNSSFTVIFNGATQATGDIFGDWIFEGGVSLGGGNTGASFTALTGSRVTVASLYPFTPGQGGRIIFKKNTGSIVSSAATLKFSHNSFYVLDNNLNASIPAATWVKDSLQSPNVYDGVLGAPASTILLSGNISQLQYLGGVPVYGRVVVDLPELSADANLSLPDGARIRGNLEILHTNNHTLTLLAPPASTSDVLVEIGSNEAGGTFGGNLVVSGSDTKVAMAKATAAAPATSYKLLVNKSFRQSGGNFSLQDFDNVTGVSTLAIRDNLLQTGGSFITNSTSAHPAAKFVVVMDDPNFVTGPSGYFVSARTISMSSGSIDNSRHMVSLKIDHTVYALSGYESLMNGVILQTPLQVGKLELSRSPLTTSSTNLLTINNPAANAVAVGSTGKSYVNGPMRRATNSMVPYLFPTGKGNTLVSAYVFDSCFVVPTTTVSSIYRAEYFNSIYNNLALLAPLKGISNTKYWEIYRISGSDAVMKFVLNASVNGASATDGIVVSQFGNGQWKAGNGSLLTPGTIASGTLSTKTLADFGAFTFGYLDPSSIPSDGGSGLSYNFYQGVFEMLPDFNTLTPVKTGVSNNVDLSIRPAGVNDAYAAIWQGTINIPAPGTYTFETISDDGSKLYFNTPYNVNATALVNNDGSHAAKSETGTVNVTAAGAYPITITFFESYGGEEMQVYWSGPGISRQQIPDAAFKPAASTGNGLFYKFYQGNYTALPDFNSLTPSKTGTSTNVDLNVRPAGVNDEYALMWQGNIKITTPGTYTFETISDDGSKLYFNTPYNVNATALVDNDGLHAAKPETGTVTITAEGLYPITIVFFENSGGEAMELYWSGPGIARQRIPDAAFTGTIAPPPADALGYKYYEGDFDMLPDFTSLTPVKTGASANLDLGVRTPGVNDHYAFMWQGYINIPTAGNYTFETISDDGSKVYFNTPYSFNGSSLVNNDGLHPQVSVSGTVNVPIPGVYPITITFFEKDSGESMQLYWSGPGFSRQLVPDAAFTVSSNVKGTSTMGSARITAQTKAEPENAVLPKIYPNPFVETFVVDYYHAGNSNSKISIDLYDLKGRLVYNYQPANLTTGHNRWSVNLASKHLTTGVYLGQVKINGFPSRTFRLIKTTK